MWVPSPEELVIPIHYCKILPAISSYRSLLPNDIDIEPEIISIAPIIPIGVNFSGVTKPGNNQVVIDIGTIVKIGAKAKIALTFEACQCWRDSAKQP